MNQPQTIADVVKEAATKGKAASEERKAAREQIVSGKEAAAVAPATIVDDKTLAVFKAVKMDDQGVITLCASSIAKDRENDTAEKGAMIGMAFDFCAGEKRVFHANHDKAAKIEARLVESCIGVPVLKSGKVLEPGEEITAEDPFDHVKAMDAGKACNTHWFVSVQPTDPEILKAAKEGKIVGASWGGLALKAAD